MTNYNINLQFLEPYRIVKFAGNNSGKELRGSGYARWKKNAFEDKWEAIITGTLLRSVSIRAAEEILSIRSGEWEGEPCCNGNFKTNNKKKDIRRYRKRPTLKWSEEEACGKCYFCRFLTTKKPGTEDKYFNFGNLFLSGRYDFTSELDIEKIATERILNRVDPRSGKAFDYFKVWEVEDEEFWNYKGKLKINDEEVITPHVQKLLKDSISFIDQICGALCIIEVSLSSQESTQGQDDQVLQTPPPDENKRMSSETISTVEAIAAKAADDLTDIFTGTNNIGKLRTFADVIRAMRTKEPEDIVNLLEAKTEREHHIWDLKTDDRKVREVLLNVLTCSEVMTKAGWRTFCESLGQKLFDEYKGDTGGTVTPERILGDTEYYAEQAEAEPVTFINVKAGRKVKEWIFTGTLKAETPFFLGKEPEGGDHTSVPILLDRKTRKYRIPRSVFRGILRRDLYLAAEGTGCNVEIGMKRPCICPVCTVMKGITVKDSKSNYSEPPDIRHRNRRNSQTATVDEGALFDIEVGPEGIIFPFIMRFRNDSGKLPTELEKVIRLYEDRENGGIFLGGSGSTGKGRFSLEGLKVYEWNLNDLTQLNDYINKWGLREELEAVDTVPKDLKDQYNSLKDVKWSEKSAGFNPWTKVSYEITIKSPILSADPIAALLDDRNSDSIFYKKRFWNSSDTEEKVTFKGESIRGLFRTAFGRSLPDKDGNGLLKIEHEDCSCELCRLFGNEHEAGRIRFEDLEINNAIEKHMDHVSIDRFQGGAAEQKKFDDHPLVRDSGEIKLNGSFWIRTDLLSENKNDIKGKFKKALCDIRNGLYPLGGKGGIGYGWVEEFKIEQPEIFKIPDRSINPDPSVKREINSQPLCEDLKKINISMSEGAVYYPHYFLEPHKDVKRESKLIGHEKFHDDQYTGEIQCTLTTETPLIISNTDDGNAFDMNKEHAKHRNYKFFRINNDLTIPGSAIRGPISSVYETLTNSCFRVFEEKRYLTKRMGTSDDFEPGIVEKKNNGKLFIHKTEAYRLPLYDDLDATKFINNNISPSDIDKRKDSIESAKASNITIADIAGSNRTILKGLINKYGDDVLQGKVKVCFETHKNNPKDIIAELVADSDTKGFIKFTGLNMVNHKSITSLEPSGYPDGKIESLNILLSTFPSDNDNKFNKKFLRKSLKKQYPRPLLWFRKDGKEYTIPKRCERVFLSTDEDEGVIVPEKVIHQYVDILKDYKNNYSRIDKKFQTKINHIDLKDGDLVYFKHNRREVIAIIPVPISRKTDTKPLGKRFFNNEEHSYNLRPCEREILEDIDKESLAGFSEKYLLRRHEDGLCPACRLFGTTSYKSRVRIGFAELQGKPTWLMGDEESSGKPLTLPLLEKPRPTWSMPNNESKVPGRKFYVHHNGWQTVKGLNEKPTENNRTVEPLDKGNTFKFKVFFENLNDWELGLLLYTLKLEDNMAHKIGMGKALGFGSVKIKAYKLQFRKSAGNWEDETDNNDFWIEKGLKWLKGYGDDLNSIAHLQGLRKLLTIPEDNFNVIYPKLKKDDENNPEERNAYVDLKKIDRYEQYLVEPWKTWHPLEIPQSTSQSSTGSVSRRSPVSSRKKPAPSEEKKEGRVKWFDKGKGFGFIVADSGEDIFVHISSLKDCSDLKEGQRVRFSVIQSEKGPEAIDVEVLS